MSRKSQMVLRHLKRLEKQFQDQSIIEEIEEVLSSGSYKKITELKTSSEKSQGQQETATSDDEASHATDVEMEDLTLKSPKTTKRAQLIDWQTQPSDMKESPSLQRQVIFASDHLNIGSDRTESQKEQQKERGNELPSITQKSPTRSAIRNPYVKATLQNNVIPQCSQQEAQGLIGNGRDSQQANTNQNNHTTERGTLHANKMGVDKLVILKKGMARPHIHRYTLRFKTIKARDKEEGHQIVQETLQKFFGIVLQADRKTIIPPYLELDRMDRNVPDLSNVFPVSSIDSYYTLKNTSFASHLDTKQVSAGVVWFWPKQFPSKSLWKKPNTH